MIENLIKLLKEMNGGEQFWSPYNRTDKHLSSTTIISNISLTPNIHSMTIYQIVVVTVNNHQFELLHKVNVNSNKSYEIFLHFAKIDPNIIIVRKGFF